MDAVKYYSITSQVNNERSLREPLKTNPKFFHSYIKHRRIGSSCVGPIKMTNGLLTDGPITMDEFFSDLFASVSVSVLPDSSFSHQTCEGTIDELHESPERVECALNSLVANNCSMGFNEMHATLLKTLSTELSCPQSLLFNNSLQSGELSR